MEGQRKRIIAAVGEDALLRRPPALCRWCQYLRHCRPLGLPDELAQQKTAYLRQLSPRVVFQRISFESESQVRDFGCATPGAAADYTEESQEEDRGGWIAALGFLSNSMRKGGVDASF